MEMNVSEISQLEDTAGEDTEVVKQIRAEYRQYRYELHGNFFCSFINFFF